MTIELRPQLQPFLSAHPLDTDRLLIHGGDQSVVVHGTHANAALSPLLEMLDGTRTVDELSELTNLPAGQVSQMIDFLDQHRLLRPGGPDVVPDTGDTSFWLATTGELDPIALTEQAAVRVVGDGALAEMVTGQLRRAGVGEISVGTTADDAPTATQPTVIVACTESGGPLDQPVLDEANAASMISRIPFLPVSIEYRRAVVGPTVLPGDSACFACYTARLRGNLLFAEDAMAVARHVRETRVGGPAVAPVWTPFARLVADYAVLETLRIVTRAAAPSHLNSILSIDALTSSSTRHDVLRLPRCEACGTLRNRPQMKLWDLQAITDNSDTGSTDNRS